MNMELEISYTHTTCRKCVFSQYDEAGKTQTGCSLGKLDDYRNAGIEVLDVYDDEEVEFNLINGRLCLFYRNEEVMSQFPRNTWEDIVRLQTKIPYHAIIFVEKDTSFADINMTIKSLKAQEIQPNIVTLINKQFLPYSGDQEHNIKPSVLLEILSDNKFLQYSLKNVYNDELTDRDLIDLVFDSNKDKPHPFYIVFRGGFEIPTKFSNEFNDSMLVRMLQPGFVKPVGDLNGMIINKTTHKKYGGNSFGIHLEEKMIELEENTERFIYEVEDICPSMKR